MKKQKKTTTNVTPTPKLIKKIAQTTVENKIDRLCPICDDLKNWFANEYQHLDQSETEQLKKT